MNGKNGKTSQPFCFILLVSPPSHPFLPPLPKGLNGHLDSPVSLQIPLFYFSLFTSLLLETQALIDISSTSPTVQYSLHVHQYTVLILLLLPSLQIAFARVSAKLPIFLSHTTVLFTSFQSSSCYRLSSKVTTQHNSTPVDILRAC
jgi:hypothetical protein